MLFAKRFLVVLGLALVGCEIDDPCDANQREEHGVCMSTLSDAGADGSPDGGDGDAGDAGCLDDPHAYFDDPCTRHDSPTDCPCSAYICVAEQMDQEGYCSRLGCLDDETICPSGWDCLDVEAFDPRAVGGLCFRP